MTARTSSSAWVRGIVAMFAASGVATDALLAAVRWPRARLANDAARFDPDEVSALWDAALRLSGNPLLGVDRALAERFADLDAVGFAMLSCETLHEGLREIGRYLDVISSATTFALEPEGDDCWVVMGHAGHARPLPPQRSAYSLLALLVASRWATRRNVLPLRVRFGFAAPGEPAAFEQAFGAPVAFGGPDHRMLLRAADLREPLPTRDRAMLSLHERLLEERIAALGDDSLRSRVSAEVVRRLARGEPRRQDIAEALGLADRTLQRRLQAEGASFQGLVDDARRGLAQKYLADPRYSLGQVAWLLGFAGQSNFFRACRRWFGRAAGEERERLIAGS